MIERLQQINWAGLFKTWWFSILLIPFIIYHLHQAYWILRFNIFFSISYSFPFPINMENFLVRNFLLIVHEAGHTFFGILGIRSLTILGGSLNELLLPVFLLGYFIINKLFKWTQFGFYLLGSAWLSVAFYVSDASARQLPLIGNLGKESHDWGNLLTRWDLLQYDTHIATAFVLTGAACYVMALISPLFFQKVESIKIDLDL